MKNYVVKALTNFDDYQGLEINPDNPKVRRNTKDVFNVTKERYEHLKNLNLVVLVGIDKVEEIEIEESAVISDASKLKDEDVIDVVVEKVKKTSKKSSKK